MLATILVFRADLHEGPKRDAREGIGVARRGATARDPLAAVGCAAEICS
jgi:hypothetical protein